MEAKIGANPYMNLNWAYTPRNLPTVNAKVFLRGTDMNLLNFNNNNRLSFSYFHSAQEMYFSNIHWKYFDIKGGIRNDIFDIRNVRLSQFVGDYDFEALTNDYLSLFADARADTFDDGYFPARGVKAGVSYAWTFAGLPHRTNEFQTLTADAKVVVPIGTRLAFIPSFNARLLLGNDIPLAYFNAMGGNLPGRYVNQQIPFYGINKMAAMKNILTVYRADIRVKLAKNHYITAIANYARSCDFLISYAVGPGYRGAALEYSYDTIFGPLSANIHWSDFTGKVGFYISAGYNF